MAGRPPPAQNLTGPPAAAGVKRRRSQPARPSSSRSSSSQHRPPRPPPLDLDSLAFAAPNPLWICCLCCPSDLTARCSSAVDDAASRAFDGAAECLGRVFVHLFRRCDALLALLGPVVCAFALGIVALLGYTFFAVILPMIISSSNGSAGDTGAVLGVGIRATAHVAFVVCIIAIILHNYCMCVVTRHDGPEYDAVVRELADATGFSYPETEGEIGEFKLRYEETLVEKRRSWLQEEDRKNSCGADSTSGSVSIAVENDRTQTEATAIETERPGSPRRRVSGQSVRTNGAVTTKHQQRPPSKDAKHNSKPPPAWMLLDPDEWSYCPRSRRPKPPRSHHDAVTGTLVLNLDHYCPWTYNAVGYFNYRYFTNFLLYVVIGVGYALWIAYVPFRNCWGEPYEEQMEQNRAAGHDGRVRRTDPFVPTPEERPFVVASYVLSVLVFLGVSQLLGFHLYLILTAQTTIERRGNATKAGEETWTSNPYSLGWRRNWQLVYGSRHPLLAVLPSRREPEFLPLPIGGRLVRRRGRFESSGAAEGVRPCGTKRKNLRRLEETI